MRKRRRVDGQRTVKLIDPSKIGKKGGKQRAKNMTPEERSESARKAAEARWGKKAGDKAGE
jgi:hypothetical protein